MKKTRALTNHVGLAEHLKRAVDEARPREGWTVRTVKTEERGEEIYLECHGTFVKSFISVGGLQAYLRMKGMRLSDVTLKDES